MTFPSPIICLCFAKHIMYICIQPYGTGVCDRFEEGSIEKVFPNGTTSIELCINTTDDDIYEGDESFSCVINDPGQELVILGNPSTAEVVIKDDEKCKVIYVSECIFFAYCIH